MSEKPPYVCEPTDQSQGRPATFIFLHGLGDDAQGLPLGIAQQFQFHNKLPYLRWLLPNAPYNPEAYEQAWFMPKALPSPAKPRISGHEEEDEQIPDDEDGIMKTVETIDKLVKEEMDRGVEGNRIVVGGFSQGCATSIVWGLTGELRNQVAGVVCASGYFPLAGRIKDLRKEMKEEKEKKQWLCVHGSKDMLVARRLFEHETQEIKKWVPQENVEDHIYEGMGHSFCNAELRDMLSWFTKVVPP